MQYAIFKQSSQHDDESYVVAVEALQDTLGKCAADWGVPAVPIVYYGASSIGLRDARSNTIVASMPEAPGAEAYHTDDNGNIYSKTLDNPDFDVVTVGMDHENKESLLDPLAFLTRTMPDGREMDFEICDPVQGDVKRISATVGNKTIMVAISNYVLPSYFDPNGVGPFDAFGLVTKPFEIRPGGYAVIDGNPEFGEDDERAMKALAEKRANPFSRFARRAARRFVAEPLALVE